jgi:steroid 5-alpha reductase family enzyme
MFLTADINTAMTVGALWVVLVMAVVTLVGNRTKNAGLVDVVWGFGFLPMVLIGLWTIEGLLQRQVIIAAMVGLSSLRLGFYLLRRFRQSLPEEDPRYHALRVQWGEKASPWMFTGVFYLQGSLMWALSLPFWVICDNPLPALVPLERVALALWGVAWIGESVADQQLARFKRDKLGSICNIGLWRYSRHPNYFFQWLQWVAYWLMALPAGGWWTVYAPLLMLHFLVNVTGIAPTEAHMLATRGEAFRRYQETTSAFVPWLPKKA